MVRQFLFRRVDRVFFIAKKDYSQAGRVMLAVNRKSRAMDRSCEVIDRVKVIDRAKVIATSVYRACTTMTRPLQRANSKLKK